MKITEAVILMAGTGSRLATRGDALPKPLLQIGGQAVFSYTMAALQQAGIDLVHVVTGYNSHALVEGLTPLVPRGMTLNEVYNSDWQKQNGISALTAQPLLKSPFLLTMGDHLFDSRLADVTIRQADPDRLNVAVDRKLNAIFDLPDAMKIKSEGDKIIAIGKNLKDYDGIDTGLFVCPIEFFDYLESAKREGDCSLADGVRLMAGDGKVRAIDVGDAWWQDIDTPQMLAQARSVIEP